MLKISAKFNRGHPQRRHQMQVEYVKTGDFQQTTWYNSKTSTTTSIVNLVLSQVYHTEHPPLFAASLPWCSTLRGFVSDNWYLLMQCRYSCAHSHFNVYYSGLTRGHVANRHISISQLLSLWRHSHCDVICYSAGHAQRYGRTYVTYRQTPYHA